MRLTKKQRKAWTALGIVFIVTMLGIAGRVDYTEETTLGMSEEAYREIKDTLGEGASEYEIARYYNKEYKSWEGKE